MKAHCCINCINYHAYCADTSRCHAGFPVLISEVGMDFLTINNECHHFEEVIEDVFLLDDEE